jgi:hypothetical protein
MLGLDNIGKTRCVLIYPINKMYAIRYQMIKLKYTVRNSKKTKLNKQKTMCTRMIFATVLSPTIKIFHWHLGPNLYIFTVKVSPWFHPHFMTYHRHFTAKKLRPSWFRAKSRCAHETTVRRQTCCSTRTHYPDSEPTSLLFLLNADCLPEKQQIPIL